MPIAKDERVDVRITSEDKDALNRAAALLGLSLTEFIRSRSLEAASQVLRSHVLITMTPRDLDRFVKALDDDVEPNEALMRASRRYKARVEEGQITE